MALCRRRNKNGTTTFFARVGAGEARFVVTLKADNERQAARAYRDLMSQYERGAYEPVTDIRVGVLAEQWLRQHVKPNLRPTTAAALEGYWRRVWEPLFAKRVVSSVRAVDVERYLANPGECVSTTTAVRAVKALSSLLEYGVRHGHLHVNPVRKVVLPRPPRTQRRVLNAENLRRLVDASRSIGVQEHAIITLLATSALRKGECLATRLEDLNDLYGENPTITIRGTAYRREVLDGCKSSSSSSTVPIGTTARDAIANWLLERPTAADGDQGTLFCDRHGRPLPDNRPNSILRRCLKEAGLPEDAVTVHGLRASVASVLAAQGGASARTTQALLRHSSYSLTNSAYEVVTAEHIRVAADALDAIVGTPIQDELGDTAF